MQSVQDLRSKAVDRKREVKSKTKWGQKWNDNQAIDNFRTGPGNKTRPQAEASSKRWTESRRRRNAKEVNGSQASRKQDILGEGYDDNEINERVARDIACEPYCPPGCSFDDLCLDGTSVLGTAVTSAVKRFEDGQTVKLVKEEYDDLSDISEDERRDASNDEEDFEFV